MTKKSNSGLYQQVQGSDSLPVLGTGEAASQNLGSVLGHSLKKDTEVLQHAQRREMGLGKGLEHTSYEKQ